MADRLPPKEKEQRLHATDPAVNAWVAANAGSGKTSILKNRVIRLLLAGSTPDRILCLTYTKAAAAEMQNRIFAELAGWVTLDDAALDRAIGTILTADGSPAGLSPSALEAARTLFARAIETPGGLKIQTIHAFAERILRLFPLESGVPLNFEILDEATAAGLLEEARQACLRQAIRLPQAELGESFTRIVTATGLSGFAETLDAANALLGGLAIKGEALAATADRNRMLRRRLGLGANETRAGIDARRDAALPGTGDLASWAEGLRQFGPNQTRDKAIHALEQAAQASDEAGFSAAFSALTTADERFSSKILGVKQQAQAPELVSGLKSFIETWRRWLDEHAAFEALERSSALMVFAEAVHARFEARKRARNALDFNDLIGALRRLVRSDHAGWIMMKLDAAIDHILVDEAQDTTPDMWDILRALTEEFFAGEGSVRRSRSLFVVGDEKQSIFSFQGANPIEFEGARQHFGAVQADHDRIRKPVPLNYSFRTSPDLLELVDKVFEEPAFRAGVALSSESIQHEAAWTNFPGEAVLLPLISPPRPDQAPPGPRQPPAQMLAEAIARQIEDWLRSGARHLRDGKPIRPGDILILVQQRDGFFEAMLRALKRRRLPVAGADRLKLQEHIAVQDLLVIAEAVLCPGHDLAVATALRTPLLGISDALLERIARSRKGSLWDAVQADAEAVLLAARLNELASAARRLGPYAFLARLLSAPVPGAPGLTGRQALQNRLGSDIHDPVDALLQEALAFEGREAGSVLLFLLDQRSRSTQIKRDMDQSGDLVRVMTVHGSKGLEGRIVFLCDTTRGVKSARSSSPILTRAEAPLLIWLGSGARRPSALDDEFEAMNTRQREENRRLFYVAMTRASDRLVVGGLRNRPPSKVECEGGEEMPLAEVEKANWYQMARDGFRRHPRVITTPDAEAAAQGLDGLNRVTLRIPPSVSGAAVQDEAERAAHMVAPAARPAWLARPAAAEPAPARRLVPSRLAGPEATGPRDPAIPDPRVHGVVVHRLFELLAPVPAAEREAGGLRWLGQAVPSWDVAMQRQVLAPVLALMANEDHARWFGPQSRAEVALAGAVTLTDGHAYPLEARIDRLVIESDRIGVLDIKTGHRGDTVPAGILRQMAVYARLLGQLYPGRPVDVVILWTRTMHFETLPPAALDDAFANIVIDVESQRGVA